MRLSAHSARSPTDCGNSSRPSRLEFEENIGAADIELTPDDLREIESAASKINVQGARYPEHLERRVGR